MLFIVNGAIFKTEKSNKEHITIFNSWCLIINIFQCEENFQFKLENVRYIDWQFL